MAHSDAIAADVLLAEPVASADRLSAICGRTWRFRLTPRALEGLRTYYAEAARLGLRCNRAADARVLRRDPE